MSKTLETFGAWFSIAIAKPKKCVGPRESKVTFSAWKWEILVWFKHFFHPNVYVSDSLSLH